LPRALCQCKHNITNYIRGEQDVKGINSQQPQPPEMRRFGFWSGSTPFSHVSDMGKQTTISPNFSRRSDA